MEEIPNLVVSDLLSRCRSAGLPVNALVKDLGYSRRQLANPFARGDWNRFTLLLDRVADAAGDEGLERLGGQVMRRYAPVNAIARRLVDPEDLYRFINGIFAPWLFPHMRGQQTSLGAGRLCLTLEIPHGYRASRPYLKMSLAAQRTLPLMIGGPPAEIEAKFGDRRGQYWLRLPAATGRKLSSAALAAANLLARVSEIFRDRSAADSQVIDLHQARASALARGWKLDAAQAEVARLIAFGHSDVEIAERLGLPESQASSLVLQTIGLCGVGSRPALIALFWSGF